MTRQPHVLLFVTLLITSLCVHEASAQSPEYPPPPPPPPAASQPTQSPYYQPPPVTRPRRVTRYSRYRTSWYIGFGLGGGTGWVSSKDGYESEAQGGMALIVFKLGWVARPWLLLGFDGSAWRWQKGDYWVQFNHYDFTGTFFPIFDSGLFIKVGLGAGVALLGVGDQSASSNEVGFDFKAGAGYEFQILKAFNLGLEVVYAVTTYKGGNTHDMTAYLTFTWY